jgi:isopentenyl diphosphate isomerase/L-lactate dehydrogenase-like FMN-dependent dehydrogenase
MASGVDDDVTLRANREGFLKFQLRPRRLVDVSKVDMSTEILGQRYETPIIIAPTGGHRGYHPDGEGAVARAAKIGDHLMILSTQATTSVADVIAARGRPIWSQLYATNKFEVAKHHVESMERQGSIAVTVTVDRNGGRKHCACAGSTPASARAATIAAASRPTAGISQCMTARIYPGSRTSNPPPCRGIISSGCAISPR